MGILLETYESTDLREGVSINIASSPRIEAIAGRTPASLEKRKLPAKTYVNSAVVFAQHLHYLRMIIKRMSSSLAFLWKQVELHLLLRIRNSEAPDGKG